ncbi:ABC transporter substrate-binding protein [Pseudonocardia thermophila]|jgi:Spermidine/putrescine-binding periplasmic protein|uniref:ABC transporter substrate-binding protein n=1 Tax=Pseudonocardia thermophila TaxID=1848 RepID=UPI00248DBB33|nr:extracellular solute-binding protein [Pseudonocardia thermophila]
MSRPSLRLSAVVSVLLALLATACGGAPPGAGSSSGGGRIVVYGSTGAIERIMTETIIPAFERAHGVEVTYQGVASAEALSRVLGQRGRPEASVVIANDRDVTRGHLEGVWTPLDRTAIPTLAEIDPAAHGDDGHSVSLGIGAAVIAYNAQALREQNLAPPESWLDLFDERFAHRVAIYDYALGVTPLVMMMINRAAGGTDADFTPGLDLLERHRDRVLAFPVQTAEWDQLFAQGTAWVGPTFSTRIGIAQKSGLPLAAVYPREGTPAFRIQAAIPQGAPNPDGAAKFIDFLLQPEQQRLQAETQFYAPVHPGTQLPPEVAALVPADLGRLVTPDNAALLAVHDRVAERFAAIVSG